MPCAVLTRSVTQYTVAPSVGPALRARLAARAASRRARLRAAGQPSRAGLVLEEVGVRHVERHSRLRSPDVLLLLIGTYLLTYLLTYSDEGGPQEPLPMFRCPGLPGFP